MHPGILQQTYKHSPQYPAQVRDLLDGAQDKGKIKKMLLKYVLGWFVCPLIGIINGVIRETGYEKFLGELLAPQVSTVTGIILFLMCSFEERKGWKCIEICVRV